jgi:hypothetical protein
MTAKKLNFEDFRSLVKTLVKESVKERMGEMGMSEQEEDLVAVDAAEVEPDGSMEGEELEMEQFDLDGEDDLGGMDPEMSDDMDMDMEGDSGALEMIADLIAKVGDAVDDMADEGGDVEAMESAEEALAEARRIVRRARKVVLKEAKSSVAKRLRRVTSK